jgi:tripartite-type tricarboxylate transporter receptor subunit TctC
MKVASIFSTLFSIAACLIVLPAYAGENFPNRPITMVIGFPPGGRADVLGRHIAEQMSRNIGQSVVISNQPGFGGNMAAAAVKKATADGYTVLFAPWTSYALNTALYGAARVGYSLGKDFTAVSTVADQPMVLLESAAIPAKTTSELVSLAREDHKHLRSPPAAQEPWSTWPVNCLRGVPASICCTSPIKVPGPHL